ncbi:carboxyl transferase domain-containing protein [Chloroflexota bacterium]
MTSWMQKINGIEQERRLVEEGGGVDAITRQHESGKMTARERIAKLLDTGTLMEFEPWDEPTKTGFDIDEEHIPADAVVTGSGEINGRPIYLYAQDFTTVKGTMATVHMAKITQVMERALKARIPLIGIIDSAGMRIEDALVGHRFYSPSSIMYLQTLMSGVVPQISLVMGPCVGEMACSTALADFVFMVEGSSYMHLISNSSDADIEQLKDVKLHSRISGCCDFVAKNDEHCLNMCKRKRIHRECKICQGRPLGPGIQDERRRA